MCAQETGITEEEAEFTKAVAFKWHFLHSPALKCGGTKTSCGVAVFVRKDLAGIRWPAEGSSKGILWPRRAIHVIMDIPGLPETAVVCAYPETGKGLNKQNRALLAKIGSALEGKDFIAAADWNITPSAVEFSGLPRRLGASLVVSKKCICFAGTSAVEYDFFMVFQKFTKPIEQVATIAAWPHRPHVPTQILFKEDIATATHLVYRQAPQLPNARVFGPLPRVDGQSAVVAVAELAAETAKNGSLTGAHFLIQTAYRHFANLAEREIAAATDKPLKRWGMRGRGLTCAVESIMWPKASSNAGKDVYSGWLAVLNYVKELVLEAIKNAKES